MSNHCTRNNKSLTNINSLNKLVGLVNPTPNFMGPKLTKSQKRNIRKRRSRATLKCAIELEHSGTSHWTDFDYNYERWTKSDNPSTPLIMSNKKHHFEQFLITFRSHRVTEDMVSTKVVYDVFNSHYVGQILPMTNELFRELFPLEFLVGSNVNWTHFPKFSNDSTYSEPADLLPQMCTKTKTYAPNKFSREFDPTTIGSLSDLLLTPSWDGDMLSPQSGHLDEVYQCAQTAYDKVTLLGVNVTALFAGVIACPNPHFLVGILTTYIVTLALYYYLLGTNDRNSLTPQSGILFSVRTLKTAQQLTSSASAIVGALIPLVSIYFASQVHSATIQPDLLKVGGTQFSPQAGYLDEADGSAFTGKPNNSKFPRNKEPKKVKRPKNKPTKAVSPGAAYAPLQVSATFSGPPKPKKDSTANNGLLNGFAIGI